MDEAAEAIEIYRAQACEEIALLVSRIKSEPVLMARLGEPLIEAVGDGAFVFSCRGVTVALRSGISGELLNSDLVALYNLGATGPAIFVNIIECCVYIERGQTQNAVLAELEDQLKA